MNIIILKVIVVSLFVGMMYMNYISNSKPLNHRTQEDISKAYPSLFTPSGYAFSIWGIIYILLGASVVKLLITKDLALIDTYMVSVMVLFAVTSLLNIAWLLLWHYDYIIESTLIMICLLIANVMIVYVMPNSQLLYKISFSLYAGWIMVALIANTTIMFVKMKLPIFEKNEVKWYLIMITVGLVVLINLLSFDYNLVVGLVFIWEYLAIFLKHKGKSGHYLQSDKPIIYTGVIVSLVFIITVIAFVINDFNLFL